MKQSVVFAAGGTGGHIAPAIAVYEAIQRHSDIRAVFIGIGREAEQKMLSSLPVEYQVVPFFPIVGKSIGGILRALCQFPKAFFQARRLLLECQPKFVIGFGGYPSVVPVIAAWSLGLPVFLHEQNRVVGYANKLLSLFVQRIYCAPGTSRFWKSTHLVPVSMPVRQVFLTISSWQKPSEENPLTLLILGGSQGAVRVNNAILTLIPFFQQNNIRIIHQTGAVDFEKVEKRYRETPGLNYQVFPFSSNIPKLLSDAHLVVSRAGAMAVAECSAAGRPVVYIPLAIANAHQKHNTLDALASGAAVVVQQTSALEAELADCLIPLLSSREQLAEMASNATALRRSLGVGGAEDIASSLAGYL